jgi:small subunit ribosomal protein S6
MHTYEIAVLFHPDLEIDLSKPQAKVEKIFTDNGGSITKTDSWGKKKLAYKIAGQENAIYVFYTLELPAESVRKIETTLNITDEVIRYLITRPDLKAIAKAEEMRAEKAAKAEARAEKADKKEEA